MHRKIILKYLLEEKNNRRLIRYLIRLCYKTLMMSYKTCLIRGKLFFGTAMIFTKSVLQARENHDKNMTFNRNHSCLKEL